MLTPIVAIQIIVIKKIIPRIIAPRIINPKIMYLTINQKAHDRIYKN